MKGCKEMIDNNIFHYRNLSLQKEILVYLDIMFRCDRFYTDKSVNNNFYIF